MPDAELKRLCNEQPQLAQLTEIDIGGRSLLNQTSDLEWRFSHYTVQEFLVVSAFKAQREFLPQRGGRLRGTDQILRFLTAMAYKAAIPKGVIDGVEWQGIQIEEVLGEWKEWEEERLEREGEWLINMSHAGLMLRWSWAAQGKRGVTILENAGGLEMLARVFRGGRAGIGRAAVREVGRLMLFEALQRSPGRAATESTWAREVARLDEGRYRIEVIDWGFGAAPTAYVKDDEARGEQTGQTRHLPAP